MVSDEGHIKSKHRYVKTFNGKTWCYREIPEVYPLKEKDIRGYKNVCLISYNDEMRPQKRIMRQIHRLVLETFNPVDGMDKLQVNHKNGVKSDNRPENLEWCTCKENVYHCYHVLGHYRIQDGSLNCMAKLNEEQVKEILVKINKRHQECRETMKCYLTFVDAEIAKEYGVTREIIRNIRLGKSWKCVPRII